MQIFRWETQGKETTWKKQAWLGRRNLNGSSRHMMGGGGRV